MIRRTRIRKRSAKARLVSEADKLVRELVMARDGCCVRCGKTSNLQAAHILPKGRVPRLRFELLNVIAMCVGCHLFFWHKNPVEAAVWIREAMPGRVDDLHVMAAIAPKVDVKELIAGLRVEVEALKTFQPDKEPASGEQANAQCEPHRGTRG